MLVFKDEKLTERSMVSTDVLIQNNNNPTSVFSGGGEISKNLWVMSIQRSKVYKTIN